MKKVVQGFGTMLLAAVCAAQTAPVTAPAATQTPSAAPAPAAVQPPPSGEDLRRKLAEEQQQRMNAVELQRQKDKLQHAAMEVQARAKADWAQLFRYQEDDVELAAPAAGEQRVVFFGDSITDAWGRMRERGPFFPGKPYVNRGISGQTTQQMIVRFHQDVVNLHPKVVLILAGTNDVAENTGPMTPEMTVDNFRAMVEMARANHIVPVIASVLPAAEFGWHKGLEPAGKIRVLNQQLKDYCQAEKIVWVDYYSALADENGAMKAGLSEDGVHPNAAGYALMAPLAEAGIAQALK